MQWTLEEITRLEEIVNRLSGEINLAKPESDEGLLPIFSLGNELVEDFAKDPSIGSLSSELLSAVQPILDGGQEFDQATIDSMKSTATCLSDALLKIANEDSPESEASNEETETPLEIEDADSMALSEDLGEDEGIIQMPSPIAFEDAPEEPAPSDAALEPERIDRLANIAQQFSGELLLAEKGSDEGMLPIYSLISELADEFDSIPSIQEALQPVSEKLDELLDNAKPFDSDSMALLTEFNIWIEGAINAFKDGSEPASFSAPASEVEEPSIEEIPEDEEDDLIKEFSEFDVVMDLNMEENQELLVEFHAEAVDHLGQIEEAVLELEQDVTNRDGINSMFRSFHTIKGVAGFLNLIPVNRLAHEVESLMDLVRNDELTVFTGLIDLVLESKDAVSKLIEQISVALSNGALPSEVIPVSRLMARARWAMEGPEKYAERMGDSAPVQEASPETGDTEPNSMEGPETTAEPAKADTPGTAKAAKKQSSENASIRVNTWKLDNLMDMVGELVIVQSQLQESSKDHTRENSSLLRNLSQLSRITKDLQHTSMALRMIPIKPTFQKMSRIVRDLSAKSGKKVRFEMSGEDTELDRNVVEEIGDPLVQMVRNSLDHGLEEPEERAKTDKDITGYVTLKAYHKGSSIVIELTDDGRGIDPDRIFKKALENGIVREDDQLSNEDIYKLIFAPGFSTAAEVTDISGRGVGMDVVKKNIEKLRGKIEIESELGKGSTFRILLPLTMAIVDGLVVKVGQDRFILPTTSVKVALRPEEQMLAKIQGNEEVLNLRGKVIPLFRLHNHFQIPGAETDPKNATVVVVETAGRPCGLLVDDMISKQEVVIKSLGSMMQGLQGISGGAILGDGNIALILDPVSLVNAA